jgi:hypothetical protein
MRTQDIAAMLNQFAAGLHGYGRSEAVATLADMMDSLWDARMRARLAALMAEGGAGLSDIALEAARRICGGRE